MATRDIRRHDKNKTSIAITIKNSFPVFPGIGWSSNKKYFEKATNAYSFRIYFFCRENPGALQNFPVTAYGGAQLFPIEKPVQRLSVNR